MKKIKFLATVLTLFITVCCILAGCSQNKLGIKHAEKDPLKYLNTAIEKTGNELFPEKETDTTKLFDALAKKGSVTVDVDIPSNDASVEVDFSYDMEKYAVYASMDISANGQKMELQIWADGDNLCLKAPELLGDTAYGISFETLEEDLASSEIWDLMGINYEDIKDSVHSVIDYLESMLQDSDDGLSQQLKQYAEKIKLVFNDITYSAAASGEDAVEITCTMTKEQMDKLADLLMDASADAILDSFSDIPGMTDNSMTEVMEQLRASLKDVCGEVTVKVTISNESGLITAVSMLYTMEQDGDTYVLNLVADMEDLKNITITVSNKTNDEDGDSLVLKIKNNDSADGISRKITLKVNGENTASLSYTYSGNSFKLKLVSGDDTIIFSGKCKLTDTKLKLYDMSLEQNNEETEIPLKITLNAEANLKKMPEFTNILTMNKGELQKLLSSFAPST